MRGTFCGLFVMLLPMSANALTNTEIESRLKDTAYRMIDGIYCGTFGYKTDTSQIEAISEAAALQAVKDGMDRELADAIIIGWFKEAGKSIEGFELAASNKNSSFSYSKMAELYRDKTPVCESMKADPQYAAFVMDGDFSRSNFPKTPIAHYEFRALQGDLEAAKAASGLYGSGAMGAPNDQKMFEWSKFAADRGDAREQRSVAQMYLTGIGVKANPLMALKYMTLSANWGLDSAIEDLPSYRYGLTKTQIAEAARWAKAFKPIATEQ